MKSQKYLKQIHIDVCNQVTTGHKRLKTDYLSDFLSDMVLVFLLSFSMNT